MHPPVNDDQQHQKKGTSLWSVMSSVVAAMFGVQSARKRELDFTQGKASHFIIIGVVMSILFVLILWGIVKLILNLAGT